MTPGGGTGKSPSIVIVIVLIFFTSFLGFCEEVEGMADARSTFAVRGRASVALVAEFQSARLAILSGWRHFGNVNLTRLL